MNKVIILLLFFADFIFPQNCINFGAFHQPVDVKHDYLNFVFRSVTDTTSLRAILEDSKRYGYTICLNLTGARHNFQNEDGNFSIDKFAEQLNKYSGFDFEEYKEIIFCHLMFDEPHDPNNWNGNKVDGKLIDSAAALSKKLVDFVAAAVGAPADYLSNFGRYRYLDYAKPQYSSKFGNIHDFIDTNSKAAIESGLRNIYSINVLSGGINQNQMTKDEIVNYSLALLRDSTCDGLLYWKWDENYFSNITDAFEEIYNEICNITNVSQSDVTSENVITYPNPFRDHLKIAGVRGNTHISLYNIAGEVVYSGVLNREGIIKLDYLPAGFYILVLRDKMETKVTKLLKIR
ncbi:T9SS type A sorting domain-containing protein [Melioribacter sp. Ez-97]|uniref:T9SS type A sorting domain-containing protein n=1 Tax=Melioribacter sp. Ez-97 TaxID=3423434 RepID=UPI003ED92880